MEGLRVGIRLHKAAGDKEWLLTEQTVFDRQFIFNSSHGTLRRVGESEPLPIRIKGRLFIARHGDYSGERLNTSGRQQMEILGEAIKGILNTGSAKIISS